MSYFSKFPLTTYDIKGNDIRKLLPDILRRVKLKSVIKSGGMLFDKYDVVAGIQILTQYIIMRSQKIVVAQQVMDRVITHI